ncbi:hypothetical protein GCM10010294_54900 [Streptomyces griseoloalbus]|nr:hypothetical protein GCM10010294_54900 [Streptomyces griseoloalbus]
MAAHESRLRASTAFALPPTVIVMENGSHQVRLSSALTRHWPRPFPYHFPMASASGQPAGHTDGRMQVRPL